MSKIERIAKKIFSLFGIEVRWTSPKCAAKHIIIKDPIQQNSLETWNDFYSDSKIVKEYLNPDRIDFYNEVIKIINSKKIGFDKKNVADIGCGPGYLLKLFNESENVASLTGFEYSDTVLKRAKEICPKANFLKFDIYDEKSQTFDLLFCTEVLEHLLYPDEALTNILNMIAKNGTLLVTVPDGRIDTSLGHINFWSPESWKVFIETNCEGFLLDLGLLDFGLINTKRVNYAIIKNGYHQH